jgi:hypothetical protein
MQAPIHVHRLPSETATKREVQVYPIGQELTAHAGVTRAGLDELCLFEQQIGQ